MSCSNCFNGCTEITSDKCVRYTGADIPALGIQNGDTLQFVEQTLAQFLISALDGSGIKPVIDPSIICSTVSANLPTCGEFTIIDLISGLIKSVCDLQEQIDVIIVDIQEINSVLAELNAFYDIPSSCFTGVTIDAESTHSVLQALLDRFCALVISLPNTYVALNGPGGIQDIINQTLEDEGLTGPTTKEYTKMVPYVAYPWFAPISVTTGNFDSNGAGLSTGPYEKIYFCNGNFPGVPDLRGRVLAGVINGMGGSTLPADVDPNVSILNPNYTLGMRNGTNYVSLEVPQMPEHNHIAISTAQPHFHNMPGNMLESVAFNTGFTNLKTWGDPDSVGVKTKNVTLSNDVTVNTTIENKGNNLPHQNNQPTVGCYYIMYIP
jgi:microcystin-dependent protein